MDTPHSAPEASSPVVLLPHSTQFNYAIPPIAEVAVGAATRASSLNATRDLHPRTRSMSSVLPGAPTNYAFPNAGMVAGPATRTSPRNATIGIHPRTRSMTSVSTGAPTNYVFPAAHGLHLDENGATGPTTRSRKRSPQAIGTIERRTEAEPDNSTSDPTEISRKRRRTASRKKPPPGAALKKPPAGASCKKRSVNDTEEKPTAEVVNCCICMNDVEPNELASINGCEHKFCFCCIEKWSERENKCPLCKARFGKIERVNKKRKKGTKNTKKVKQRDQRSDVAPGAALEGLIANLNRSRGLARIIFGGFDFQGVGAGGIQSSGAPPAPLNFSSSNRGDDDSDDEDSPMAAFMRALHGGPGAIGIRTSTTVVRPVTVTARFTTTTTRSYARNVHDSTAGNEFENPLEIVDDESVDEVIEID